MRLRTRLVLAFLLLSLLSMAAIAAIAFQMGSQQIRNDSIQRLQVTNHLTGEEFDRWLENSARTLEAIAQRPLVVELSSDISEGTKPNQPALVDQLLEVHFRPRLQEAEFETLLLLDPSSGEILASTNPDQIGKLREQHDFYLQGREETTVQTIYYSVTEQQPRLTVATPIRDEVGNLVGVLAGHLNLAEMSQIFSTPVSERQTEETYLVNARGLAISDLLYRPDAILQTWVRTEGVMECLTGSDVRGVFQDYRGVSVLGVYDWLPDYGLCLVTEIDEQEALEPIHDFRGSIIGTSLLLALFVSFIGFFYTGRLAAPVKKMRDVARRYRQGDLSARMELPATDEYRELADEFNRMAAELQKDLEALEQRYESLFESVPVGLYQSTSNGELLEANQALVDILGYDSRQELLSTPAPLIYVNAEDREHWVRQLKEQTVVRDLEVQVRKKDGTPIWLHHDAHLTTTPEGELVIEGAVFDITQRYRAEAELIRERDFSNTLLNAMPGVFYVLDTEGHFHRWNENFPEVTGYTHEEFAEMNALKLFEGSDKELVAERIGLVFEEGEASLEAEITTKDGSQIPYYFTGLRIVRDGEPRLIGMGIDITDRVEAEQKLQEYADELERSNEELEQFAYVASHDLQEPLRMVASYVQLLESRYGDELEGEAKDFIHYAVDGAQRMQQLISDLLKFSRVGTRGKDPEPVNSAEVVEDVIRSLGPRIEDTDGQVVVEGDLPQVMADPGQLHQVFQNLIGNGLKFYAEEPPAVRVSASKNGSKWRFAVADNGIGIDPKYSDRLFTIFQRLHTRKEYEGTGIGLAITKKIIERHDGDIWFESEPGGGSTFYFTLDDAQEEETRD